MADIRSTQTLSAWFADGAPMPATLIGLDLVPHAYQFASIKLSQCAFIGCTLDPALLLRVQAEGGAYISPSAKPFQPFRASLYDVPSIYAGFDPTDPQTWQASYDYQAYTWFMDPDNKKPRALDAASIAYARLHDSVMESLVAEHLSPLLPAVGFMGGHDVPRNAKSYHDVVHIARALRREGVPIVSGGGPGLMEAANLGAFLAPYDDRQRDQALATLAAVPVYTNTYGWLTTACTVRIQLLGVWNAREAAGSSSLGIPTWLYGHEPPNLFSTHIAKLFYNSLREDGLVSVAGGGLVFGPGNAGTVQEVFQDANQNYYRDPGTTPTPMILYDRAFWNAQVGWSTKPEEVPDAVGRKKPLYPLLLALAGEKPSNAFTEALALTDDVEEIIARLTPAKGPDAPTLARRWIDRHLLDAS